jgi:SAM-dependent methyltransferase
MMASRGFRDGSHKGSVAVSEYAEWKGWNPGDFGYCPAPKERYFGWHINRAFEGAVPSGANVLELGFGNGSFLGFCRKRGYAVTGVEANPELVARAVAAGFQATDDLKRVEPSGPFHLLAAFDVLEHLDRPAVEDFFQRLPCLLANGGRALIRVPNGDSPFGRRHQHGDITHVTTLGEFKFRQLAHACGMELQAVGESPWYVDEFETFNLTMLARGIARKVLDFTFSLAYYRSRVDLSPNLVVVLRRK